MDPDLPVLMKECLRTVACLKQTRYKVYGHGIVTWLSRVADSWVLEATNMHPFMASLVDYYNYYSVKLSRGNN